MTDRPSLALLRLRLICLLSALGLFATGCATHPYGSNPVTREPLTYAVILYLAEGEVLSEEERAYALEFARDTLLASALIDPADVMIDDPERAQLLFRARMEDGQLVEIAGVPAVTQGRTVVISNPRRSYDRIWWEASYPQGIPPYFGGRYDRFPYPGPGWGYPDRRDGWHGGGGGGRRGDGYRHDGDRRDRRPPRGDDDDNRHQGPRRPDDGDRPVNRPPRNNRGTPSVAHGDVLPNVPAPINRGRPTYTPPPAPAPAPAPQPAPEPSWDRGSNDRSRYTPPPAPPSGDRGTPSDRRRGRELN